MGRRRIEIVEIRDPRRRKSTFQKRKSGILKKARELAILTGSKISLTINNDIMASSHHFHADGMENLSEEVPSSDSVLSMELLPASGPPPSLQSIEAFSEDLQPAGAEMVPWMPTLAPLEGGLVNGAEIDYGFNWDMVQLGADFMPSIDDILPYLPESADRLALDAPEISEIEQIASLFPAIEL